MFKSILVCLLLPAAAFGVSVQPGDQVTIPARTIYNDGNLALPDSVRVHVFHEGSEVFDGWYNDADIEAFTNDGWLIFSDQLQDIDGPGGTGHYLVLARAYDNDSSLYTPFLYHFEVGLTDTIFAIIDTLQNHDDWVSSLTEADRIGLDLDNIFGTLDSGEIGSEAITGFHLAPSTIDRLWDEDTTGHYTPGLYGYEAARSGGGDSTSIARWVWNTPQLNHTTGGTFGSYLDATLSGIGSGTGIYSFGVIVFDSTTNQVIPGARLAIRNLDQTALIAVGITESDGWATFGLDVGSFLVSTSSPGYLFESWDTITVSTDDVDTVYGVQFDPGIPAWPDLCRVFGHLFNLNGLPEEGVTLTARLPSGVVRYGDLIISPFSVSAMTDENGLFLIDLISTEFLLPQGTLYEFTASRSDGTILRQRFAVPSGPNWRLIW